MARQLIVVAALVFFAIVGMASATGADPPAADAADDVIGNTDGGSEPDAAPVGGPVSSEAFPNVTPATDGPAAAGGAAASLHSLSFTGGAVLAIFASAFVF